VCVCVRDRQVSKLAQANLQNKQQEKKATTRNKPRHFCIPEYINTIVESLTIPVKRNFPSAENKTSVITPTNFSFSAIF
jgi:hypothetical protein